MKEAWGNSEGCHWWIQGGVPEARASWGSKFFYFHAVFGKNNKLARPVWEFVPPQENPGSATGCGSRSKGFSALADPMGARDTPPSRSNILNFHAVFDKNLANNRFFEFCIGLCSDCSVPPTSYE